MQFPNVSFVEFAILGALIDGEVPGETLRRILTEEFDWRVGGDQFFITIGRMKRFKLIEIHKDVTTTNKRTRQESCYAISDAGAAQWKYAYAFFRSLCDRWKNQAALLPTISSPPKRRKAETKERQLARMPNADEIVLILKEAQPEFAVVFRLAMASGQCIVALSGADITDLDMHSWTLRMPLLGGDVTGNNGFVIPENCRKQIAAAIAGRSSGSLFLTGNGVPWREENLRMCWRRLRSKLNLPKGTVMPSSRFLREAARYRGSSGTIGK